MNEVCLSPELERFAQEAIADGRYGSVAEVVAAGIGLLQRAEAQRLRLLHSVREAEAEADRDGWLSLDEVEAEMRAVIRESASRTA